MSSMYNVIVVGAGAAGMMAACAAAESGLNVLLLDRNEKAGKKLYLTGKGRCNLTNAVDVSKMLDAVPHNGKFLYSSLNAFDNQATMDFFESRGLRLKTERGNRVFPQSDHASDVTKTLLAALQEEGVEVRLNSEATKIPVVNGRARGVVVKAGEGHKTIAADAVVCACGGCSYPSTGSDGSGFELARGCGHRVTPLYPSLVPMNTQEDYVGELAGLSLKNVQVSLFRGEKLVFQDFGEMEFLDFGEGRFGVGGPLILRASSVANQHCIHGSLDLKIDLKPAVKEEELDERLVRMLSENANKSLKNALQGLLPAQLFPVYLRLSGVDPDKKANSVTREERQSLLGLLKAFPCTVTSLRGFDEAIVTRGGVDVKEVNPSTMESKLVEGLYFAGEMLDVDAMTGGYNLQIAWSTGHLAGASAAAKVEQAKA